MSINDLLFRQNIQYKEEDLKPALEHIDEIQFTEEEILEFADELKLDPNHIYLSDSIMPPLFYYKFPYYLGIDILDASEEFMMKNYKKRIEYTQKFYNEKNWVQYYLTIDGPMAMTIFSKIYPMIEDEKKYEALKEVHIQNDQGHAFLTKDMWAEALENRPEGYVVDLPVKDEVLTVYRGVGSKSASLTDTVSWSLDFFTASKFAYQGNDESKIYVGKVHHEDIMDYFPDRDEHEAIVLPESIYDLQVYEQYDGLQLFQELVNNQLINEFNFYRNTFLEEDIFEVASDIHGMKHTERVLMYVTAYSYLEGLDVNDRAVLSNAALYHDIGRESDGVELGHGKKSYERLIENSYSTIIIDCQNVNSGEEYRLDGLTATDKIIMRHLIENHDKEDDTVNFDIEGLNNQEQERLEKLFKIFKDADALDRIRLKDWNPNYFRNEHTIRLCNFAWVIYRKL